MYLLYAEREYMSGGRDQRQQACSTEMNPFSPELVSFSLEALISAG